MQRNYQARWIGNWFWPSNFVRYWTTSYDRADLMAKTLANNLFDAGLLGNDLTLGDLNTERPYLILNATNASRHSDPAIEMPFGSVFTFTREDFNEFLRSDIRSYSVSRAVMGSSAFPVVFPAMTLADFRGAKCQPNASCEAKRFMHVFDGGNSDNLGLKSIARILLQQYADQTIGQRGALDRYDRIIVIQVDAFTVPTGLPRDRPDPRSWFDRFLDLNVIQATDSLLQANRRSLIDEFKDGKLTWTAGDCDKNTRQYSEPLCNAIAPDKQAGEVDLSERMVFYHFGFAAVERMNPELKHRLDMIPTAFKLDAQAARDIDEAVRQKINADSPCLKGIADLAQKDDANDEEVRRRVRDARAICERNDGNPVIPWSGKKGNR